MTSQKIKPALQLFIDLSKIYTTNARRFSGGLDGLGFSEFTIALHLSHAEEGKMRRVDLAEKMGLTASGITRILAPMEKIGLIKREANTKDARVSYVMLTAAGKRNLADAIVKAELFAENIFPQDKMRKIRPVQENFAVLAGTQL